MYIVHSKKEGQKEPESVRGTIEKPSMFSSFVNYCEQFCIDPYKKYCKEDPLFNAACEKLCNLHYPYFRWSEKDERITSGSDVLLYYNDKLEEMVARMLSKYSKQHEKRMSDSYRKMKTELKKYWDGRGKRLLN